MKLTKHIQEDLGVPSPITDIIKGLGLEGANISELSMLDGNIDAPLLLPIALTEAFRVSEATSIENVHGLKIVTNKTHAKYTYVYMEGNNLHIRIPHDHPNGIEVTSRTDIKDTDTGKYIHTRIGDHDVDIIYKISEKGIYSITMQGENERGKYDTVTDIGYQEVEGMPIRKEFVVEDGVETVYTYEPMQKVETSRNKYRIPIYKNGSFCSFISFKIERD